MQQRRTVMYPMLGRPAMQTSFREKSCPCFTILAGSSRADSAFLKLEEDRYQGREEMGQIVSSRQRMLLNFSTTVRGAVSFGPTSLAMNRKSFMVTLAHIGRRALIEPTEHIPLRCALMSSVKCRVDLTSFVLSYPLTEWYRLLGILHGDALYSTLLFHLQEVPGRTH